MFSAGLMTGDLGSIARHGRPADESRFPPPDGPTLEDWGSQNYPYRTALGANKLRGNTLSLGYPNFAAEIFLAILPKTVTLPASVDALSLQVMVNPQVNVRSVMI